MLDKLNLYRSKLKSFASALSRYEVTEPSRKAKKEFLKAGGH